MDIQHVDGTQIRRMTADGIWYEDNGRELFVDFMTCYQNYLKSALSPETWEYVKKANNKSDADWEQYEARVRKHKVVGGRNIMPPPWADGPFIEFYLQPMIRIKFDSPDTYRVVRNHVEQNGWSTQDYS